MSGPPPTGLCEIDGLPDASVAELLIPIAGPECHYLKSGKSPPNSEATPQHD